MATPSDIAKFRHGTTADLQMATGFFYFCDDKLNQLFKQLEGVSGPAIYAVLMCKKEIPAPATGTISNQRNIYFRYDLQKVVFYIENHEGGRTGANGEKEQDVYFFPDAAFISVKDDYIALDKWIKNQVRPTLFSKNIGSGLDGFVNRTDGHTDFILTSTHTFHITNG